ncbi:MAG: ATP-dependent helicase [Nocardioides sp.]|uniref:ATP-dependent helicase n=1 Tax=Nocardioides sp. TaxID=35761 RepID=UPI003F0E20DD
MSTARRRVADPGDLRRLTGADFTVSEQQWAAISADPVPGVVIAGAGSGKTELMSARVIYLVANGFVRPDQVLGLTFTTKATAELSQRVRAALSRAGLDTGAVGDDGTLERLEPVISTYNAYAANLLSDHGLRIGHEQERRVMADASRFQLAQRVIARHQGTVRHLSDHPATVVQWLLTLDGQLSEHLVDIDDVRAFQASERPAFAASLDALVAEGGKTKGKQAHLRTVLAKMEQREELLDLVAAYRDLKAQFGLMDFSDQIAGAFRLATEFAEVGAQQRDTYRVVLLDEYQDTSVAQARLLAGLFSGPTAESGRGHAVTAVGDPNQAIYGWRGASVANIQQFREQFPQADGSPAHRFSLTVNRRSDRRILEAANVLAAPLLAEEGTLVEPLVAKPEAELGTVRSVLHRTDLDELDWLVAEIRGAHESGRAYGDIGVLVRTNKHGAEAYDALAEAEIPVEIVGLAGLIRLPEVAQVVSTLSLLDDVTDNASLLTLLSGPRWEIGPRDLALLGSRSRELAQAEHVRTEGAGVDEELAAAVEGADPTEIASLNEALESPGDLPYSPEALERFATLAAELTHLRSFVGEPLLDLLRRIMDITGLDTELASSASPAAAARRENLDLFVKAVAEFQAVDGTVTLGALNAWLDTEDEYGGGLDLAPPSESDAVKLLTVHRAKGLEYDLVFLIGTAAGKFPNTQLRSQWTTVCHELPAPLRGDASSVPQLRGCSADDIKGAEGSLDERARAHQAMEELRLGYVAFTRARHEFVVSSYVWTTTQKPLDPSPYMTTVRDLQQSWGVPLDPWYARETDEPNPRTANPARVEWPVTQEGPERVRRVEAARRVDEAGQVLARAGVLTPSALDGDLGLDAEQQALVAQWDAALDTLVSEAREMRTSRARVVLPESLSTSSVLALRQDPERFALDLLRPMPRKPSPAATFGTAFHAWIEARFGQQGLLDPDELPGRADTGIESDADLVAMQEAFDSGQFADRAPFAVEAPFSLVIAGHVVRGRIDAVYREPDGSFLLVDWKTNRRQDADPLQLAFYRVAWAELQGVPVECVRAGFCYVRTDDLVVHDDLPGREELRALLDG